MIFISRGNTDSVSFGKNEEMQEQCVSKKVIDPKVGYLNRKKQQCFILSFTYLSFIMVCIDFFLPFFKQNITDERYSIIILRRPNVVDEEGDRPNVG